jgi:cytochrome oxidase Cu insertion factor (SCO1/SenC/PrrC family)
MRLPMSRNNMISSRHILAAASAFVIAFSNISARAGDPARSAEYDYEPPVPGSYQLPVIKTAADGVVLDAQGRTLHLRDVTRGRVTVLSFIYSRCADGRACPYATGVLGQLRRLSAEDPALASGLRLVSMSFDPAVDTPAQMATYASVAGNDPHAAEWRFLTTASPRDLQPILEAYGQAVNRKANPNDPTGPLNHNLRVFLIDRLGRVRNIYSSGMLDVRLVLADVRTLLIESQSSALR